MEIKESTSSSKAIDAFRWIAFIPGATLGACLAWFIVNILGMFYFPWMERDSFIAQLYFHTIGYVALGATFVYLGAKIAPAYRQIVICVLAALGFLFSNYALFPALIDEPNWAALTTICMIYGVVSAIVYLVYRGKTQREKELSVLHKELKDQIDSGMLALE